MNNFEYKEIGTMGKEVRESFEPKNNIKLPYVGLEHIEQQTLRLSSIGNSADIVSTKKYFKANDILFGTLRPYFRKVVKPKFEGVCSTDITVLRAKKGNAQDFLFYFIASQPIIDFASISANGTKMPRAKWSVIAKEKFKIPPLPTQRKIAAILSAYDDLIENNNKRISILEKIAEEIYKEWFVRMRFPGYNKTKFVKGIPEGWENDKVENAFEFLGGGTPSKDEKRYWNNGSINWYTPSDLTGTNSWFSFESKEKCNELGLRNSSARIFPPYSIMMTSRATIGVVSINITPACTNQGFITCLPNNKYPFEYLFFWLKLNKDYFELLASGSTFLELIKSNFKKILILKPTKQIVDRYVPIVKPLFNDIKILQEEIIILKRTRDLLLPRLLSGKLSVDNLDIKFPPSMENEDD